MMGNRAPCLAVVVDRSAPLPTLSNIAQRLKRTMQDVRGAVNYLRGEAAKAQVYALQLMASLGEDLAGKRFFELVIHDPALGSSGKALIVWLYTDKRFHRLLPAELTLVETVSISTSTH